LRRRAFSPKSKFLSTCIRYSVCFRTLALAPQALLVPSVLLAGAAEASVVASARRAMIGSLRLLSALVLAVLLPMVVAAADAERASAPEAGQLVEGNAVHPATRMDRKWT